MERNWWPAKEIRLWRQKTNSIHQERLSNTRLIELMDSVGNFIKDKLLPGNGVSINHGGLVVKEDLEAKKTWLTMDFVGSTCFLAIQFGDM